MLHALRPVFREFGHPAAFVDEALAHHRGRPERQPSPPDRAVPHGGAPRAGNPRRVAPPRPRDGRWVRVPGTRRCSGWPSRSAAPTPSEPCCTITVMLLARGLV